MGVYRSSNHRKRWRMKWPWRVLFPLVVDERLCPECKLPYHVGPVPREIVRCTAQNVSTFIYPSGSYGRTAYSIRIGYWKASSGKFFCDEFIPIEEIDNVLCAVEMAKKEITALSSPKAKRRKV